MIPVCCGAAMLPRKTWTHGLVHVCSKCGQFTCQKMQDVAKDLGLVTTEKFAAFLLPPAVHWRPPSLN